MALDGAWRELELRARRPRGRDDEPVQKAIYQSMAQGLRDDSFHLTIGERLEKWPAEDGEAVPGDL